MTILEPERTPVDDFADKYGIKLDTEERRIQLAADLVFVGRLVQSWVDRGKLKIGWQVRISGKERME